MKRGKEINEKAIYEEIVKALKKRFENAKVDTLESEELDDVEDSWIVIIIDGKKFQIVINKTKGGKNENILYKY